MTSWQLQSPDEVRAYEFTWDELETGEDIEASDWTISPDLGPDTGASLEGFVIDTDGLKTQAVVSGLSVGQSYQLKNVIRTNQDNVFVREITIRCANK